MHLLIDVAEGTMKAVSDQEAQWFIDSASFWRRHPVKDDAPYHSFGWEGISFHEPLRGDQFELYPMGDSALDHVVVFNNLHLKGKPWGWK